MLFLCQIAQLACQQGIECLVLAAEARHMRPDGSQVTAFGGSGERIARALGTHRLCIAQDERG